jgi:hypothetical protein
VLTASTTMIASSTSRPSAMMSAQRNALQVDAHPAHPGEGHRQHQRDAQCDDDAGPPAERQEVDDEHDDHRLEQRAGELSDGSSTTLVWSDTVWISTPTGSSS